VSGAAVERPSATVMPACHLMCVREEVPLAHVGRPRRAWGQHGLGRRGSNRLMGSFVKKW